MATKKYTVAIGDDSYEIAATLGACVTYANEFRGKVDAPYVGLMADDMLALYKKCAPVRAVPNEDGNGCHNVENDEYEGIESHIVPTLRIVWACAFCAKSTKLGWPKFLDKCMEAEFNAAMLGGVYDAVIVGMGEGTIFRLPEGRTGSEEADEGQQA